jgi:hypothetical protein
MRQQAVDCGKDRRSHPERVHDRHYVRNYHRHDWNYWLDDHR